MMIAGKECRSSGSLRSSRSDCTLSTPQCASSCAWGCILIWRSKCRASYGTSECDQ